jgi:ferredoxin/predicted nucleic acid-binding Zn ribbon protein
MGPEAKFCPNCGAKVLSAQDAAQLDAQYKKLGSKSTNEHCDAATYLLREYGTEGFCQLAKAVQSGDDIAYDTALWAFLYELDRYRDHIDPTRFSQKLMEIMPAIVDVVRSAKLQPSVVYLDSKVVRTLNMLERYGDSSALPALRALLDRVFEKRRKDGFRREYVQGDGCGGWLDNDGWDESVKKVIDAIERRERGAVVPPPAQAAPPPEPVLNTRKSAQIEAYKSAYAITDDCIKCGACEPECPVAAIRESSGKYAIDADSCIRYGACAAVCPVEAIRTVPDISDSQKTEKNEFVSFDTTVTTAADIGMTIPASRNLGTRIDCEDKAIAYWTDFMRRGKIPPFVDFRFKSEKECLNVMRRLSFIAFASDTGELISTELIYYGYFYAAAGWEILICGDELTQSMFEETVKSCEEEGGTLKDKKEPVQSAAKAAAPVQTEKPAITFHHKEDKNSSMYYIYRGLSRDAALAFLQTLENPTQNFVYHIVETPEGSFGKDKNGIYQEDVLPNAGSPSIPGIQANFARCSSCGHELPAGARFCGQCGAKQKKKDTKRQRRKRLALIIGLVLVGLPVLILAISSAIRAGSRDQPTPQPQEESDILSTYTGKYLKKIPEGKREYTSADKSFGGTFQSLSPEEMSEDLTSEGYTFHTTYLSNETQTIIRQTITADQLLDAPSGQEIKDALNAYIDSLVAALGDSSASVKSRADIAIKTKTGELIPGMEYYVVIPAMNYEIYGQLYYIYFSPLKGYAFYNFDYMDFIKDGNQKLAEEFFDSCFFEQAEKGALRVQTGESAKPGNMTEPDAGATPSPSNGGTEAADTLTDYTFALTKGYYGEYELEQAVIEEYGAGATVADFAEIKELYETDAAGFLDAVGVAHNEDIWINNNGSGWYSQTRHYFLARLDGDLRSDFLSHGEFGGNTAWLGSWFDLELRVLVKVPK